MSEFEGSLKQEPMDTSSDMAEEQIEPPAFGPAALGLHRVGTILPPKPQPTQPIQVLNARGMPARIRKKNKLFFDDDIVNDSKAMRNSVSPRKLVKQTPSPAKTPVKILKKRRGVISKYMKPKEEEKEDDIISAVQLSKVVIPADKKIGQQIGLRLRNLLKLPKAHKWVIFEWFYSFIDKPLFDVPNDFETCLTESFPQLKTRQLARTEWSKIRSVLGKPRRCSQAFFDEERRELERRRQKIRLIQTKKTVDGNFVKDLPNELPLPLPVGTKVTARLRTPQDGIFSGTVDAVDSQTSTYRITFDRTGLGTHSIPDYEIVANDFHETISISSLIHDFRPRGGGLNGTMLSSPAKGRSALNKSDPLLGQELYENQFKNPVMARETIGGFPIKLLEYVVRVKKALAIKQSKLQRLRDMNTEAEMYKSYGDAFPDDFQRRYASIVISMEKLNRDMQEYLNQIQSYASELTKEPNVSAMLAPTYLREKCREMAVEAVQRNNQNTVNDEKILNQITDLATVMLVASHLSSESNSHIIKVLDGCIEEVKAGLDKDNVEVFQKNVQIHLHHIRLGLGQMAMGGTKSKNSSNNGLTDERTPF